MLKSFLEENFKIKSCASAVTGLPVPRDRTGKAVRKPEKIVYLRRNKMMRKGYKEPEKHEIDFWTKEDDDLLKRVYPCQTADEIQKLFPDRTPDAISTCQQGAASEERSKDVCNDSEHELLKAGVCELRGPPA